MTGDRIADVVLYGSMIILPMSALAVRRLPLRRGLGMALAWAAIFAVALVVAGQRDRFASIMDLFGDQRVDGSETRIEMAADGHFWAQVTIGTVSRRMLIDSGATTTALSTATAAAAGLDLAESPFPVIIATANGSVSARTATVAQIKVGTIVAHDIGVVVSPAFGDLDVLGMNFLSRLGSWRVERRTLILRPA